jgi:hypothetical protein
MSIDRNSYFGLAVDVGDFDLARKENAYQDLFYRPYCERDGCSSNYWLPNKIRAAIKVSPCGMEFPLMCFGKENNELLHVSDAFKLGLAPVCKAFLEENYPDYKLVLVYFEFHS